MMITYGVSEAGNPILELRGGLSDAAPFRALTAIIRHGSIVDLANVSGVTDGGAARWTQFLRGLPRGTRLKLRRVSTPMVRRMILAPVMIAGCEIESFYAPYERVECGNEATIPIDPPRGDHALPILRMRDVGARGRLRAEKRPSLKAPGNSRPVNRRFRPFSS
jgi:hypothetical protein